MAGLQCLGCGGCGKCGGYCAGGHDGLLPKTGDLGHDQLMQDLFWLSTDAFNFEFHDFKNKRHATPKVALVAQLESIAKKAKEGYYDN